MPAGASAFGVVAARLTDTEMPVSFGVYIERLILVKVPLTRSSARDLRCLYY